MHLADAGPARHRSFIFPAIFAFTRNYPLLDKYDYICLYMIAGRKAEGLWNPGQSQLRGWVGPPRSWLGNHSFGLCWFAS